MSRRPPKPSVRRRTRANGTRALRGAKVPRRLRALGGVDPRLLGAGVPYPCDDPRVGTVVPGGRSTPGGRVVACASRGPSQRGHDLFVGGMALTPRQIAAARAFAEGEARRASRSASRGASAPRRGTKPSTAADFTHYGPRESLGVGAFEEGRALPHGPRESLGVGAFEEGRRASKRPSRPMARSEELAGPAWSPSSPFVPTPFMASLAAETASLVGPDGLLPTVQAPTGSFADRVETFAQFVREDLSSLPPGTRSAPKGAWRVSVKPSREFWYVRLDGPSGESLVYEVNVRNGEITYARRSGGKNFHVSVVGVTGPERNAPRYVPAGETYSRNITLDDYTHFRWGAAWPYPMQPVYVGPRPAPALLTSPLNAKTPEKRKPPSERPVGLRTAPPLTGTWVPRAIARVRAGSAYTTSMDITEIAKRVRADIRTAQGNGALPANLEVSVTTDRYSMGRSLNLRVTSVDVPVVNPREASEATKPDRDWDDARGWVPYSPLNDAGRTILANLDAIVRAYHVDRSDAMTDYYDVNFAWSGADFAEEVLYQQLQSLYPADAPERPQVFVDYYLTWSLGEALRRAKARGVGIPWAYTDGRQSYVAKAPTKYIKRGGLPVPDLSQPNVVVNTYTAGDLNEAYELALSLASSVARKNPSRAHGAHGAHGPRRNGARDRARGRR